MERKGFDLGFIPLCCFLQLCMRQLLASFTAGCFTASLCYWCSRAALSWTMQFHKLPCLIIFKLGLTTQGDKWVWPKINMISVTGLFRTFFFLFFFLFIHKIYSVIPTPCILVAPLTAMDKKYLPIAKIYSVMRM